MLKMNKHPSTFHNFEPARSVLIIMHLKMELSSELRTIIKLVLSRESFFPKYTVIPKLKKNPVKFKHALKGRDRVLSYI
jgi:hypothetical protein